MVGDFVLSDNETHYEATAIKIVWFHSGTDKEVESDMNPCIYVHFILNKYEFIYSGKVMDNSISDAGISGYIDFKNHEIESLPWIMHISLF